MSLRDWLAGQAHHDVETAFALRWCKANGVLDCALDADSALRLEAAWRYACADAMLAERRRTDD